MPCEKCAQVMIILNLSGNTAGTDYVRNNQHRMYYSDRSVCDLW